MSEEVFSSKAPRSIASRISRLPVATKLECLGYEQGVGGYFLHGNLAVLVWLDAVTPSAADLLESAAQRVIKREQGPISVVHWLTPSRPLPGQQARAKLLTIFRDLQPYIACSAFILNGEGFWAGAIRAMVSGIRLVSPSSKKVRFDANLDETSAWLPSDHAEVTGILISPLALQEIVLQAVEQTENGTCRPPR